MTSASFTNSERHTRLFGWKVSFVFQHSSSIVNRQQQRVGHLPASGHHATSRRVRFDRKVVSLSE